LELILKKILYNLHCAIIGLKEFSKHIIGDYVVTNLENRHNLQKNLISQDKWNCLVLFHDVPFNLEITFFETAESILEKLSYKDYFDIIFLTVNLAENNPLEKLQQRYEQIREFSKKDTMYILIHFTSVEKEIQNEFNDSLISVSKKLDMLYCFLLDKSYPELSHLFKRILSDFEFQFKYSSPELFERAKAYGKKLSEEEKPYLEIY